MLNERKLTDKELEKRESAIQGLKKNKLSLVKKYGKDAEKVMYGIATKQAKTKTEQMNLENLKGMIQDALKNPKAADLNKDGELSSYEKKRGAAIEKNINETDPGSLADIANIMVAGATFLGGIKGLTAIVKALGDDTGDVTMDSVKQAIQQVKDKKSQGLEEDLDVGHQDNEPHMIKKDLYRIYKYAKELYEMVDKYDGLGEVDFPHWWQSKIVKAKDYMVSTKHYLDGEEKIKQIDNILDTPEVIDVVNEEESIQKRLDVEKIIKQTLQDEGGAAGLDALVKSVKKFGLNKNELVSLLKKIVKVDKHKHGDYILTPINEIDFDEALTLRGMKAELEDQIAQLYRDMEQEAEPEGGPIADEYGNKLDRIDKAIAKLSGRKEMDYDTAVGKVNEYDVTMPSQEEVDKFFALTQQETHYLNSKPVRGQEGTFNLMSIEPWDEYDLSNWKSLVRKAKQQGKNKSIAQTLAETIKLGEGVIEEELCPKGKAYIKRRKAAGEKSSAYLSGRAVKVCKGQMSGRKKKK